MFVHLNLMYNVTHMNYESIQNYFDIVGEKPALYSVVLQMLKLQFKDFKTHICL